MKDKGVEQGNAVWTVDNGQRGFHERAASEVWGDKHSSQEQLMQRFCAMNMVDIQNNQRSKRLGDWQETLT